MTDEEKKALVLAGISHRHEHYLQVRGMAADTTAHISRATGFSVHFITQCRKIAGWTRRKNEQ